MEWKTKVVLRRLNEGWTRVMKIEFVDIHDNYLAKVRGEAGATTPNSENLLPVDTSILTDGISDEQKGRMIHIQDIINHMKSKGEDIDIRKVLQEEHDSRNM